MKTFHLHLAIHEINLLLIITTLLLILFIFGIRSQLGYSFAIYGNNPAFFYHHQISGRYVVFLGTMIGYGCAGISGFLFAQANGFVDLTMNFGVILLCLTTLMIGKLLMPSPRPQLLIPFIGVMIFFVIQQSLLRLGFNLKYFNAFQAFFILIILYFGNRKQTYTLDHLGV